jgi:hypothetical protein
MEDHAQEMQEDCGRFLRDVQAIAGLGIYVLDIPTGSWKSSEVLDEIFGLDASSEHSIETWIDLLHADDRQAMVDYFSCAPPPAAPTSPPDNADHRPPACAR